METLVPNPTTDMDRRVNRAFELARERGCVHWVWVQDGLIYIGRKRPEGRRVIAVHPDGFAMTMEAGAEPPFKMK